jgi:vitamin K-dependent gamma-carboxylase
VFHFTNAQLFRIGIFPWMMIAATTLFFAPDWPRRFISPATADQSIHAEIGRLSRMQRVALGVYVAVQVLLPLRHWLYPGDVAWTEEGHRYSWRMMLRAKNGSTHFLVETPVGHTMVDPRDVLTSWQAAAMSIRPDMIQQFAHFLAARATTDGASWVRVRAIASASLNGGPTYVLVDPSIDLAAKPRSLRAATWIMRESRTARAAVY